MYYRHITLCLNQRSEENEVKFKKRKHVINNAFLRGIFDKTCTLQACLNHINPL